MAEQSGFFNSIKTGEAYDRVYDASDFANYFSKFIGNGVFINPTNNLQVVAKSGLTVTVKKGNAFIDGYWYELTEDMDVTFSPNATAYSINDMVCCTLNKSERKISINKKEAVSSILPVNDGTIHELVLCSIVLGVGVATITDAMITDRRPDETYCGFVKGIVDNIETAELFLQFETIFMDWFEGIKGQLGEDVAGGLQNQIDKTYKLGRGMALQSNVDLNNVVNVGNYYSNGESHANSPVDEMGYTLKVEELSTDGHILQKATLLDGKSYTRVYNSSEWTDWKLSNVNGFISLGSFSPHQNSSITRKFTPEQLGVDSLSGVFVDCIMVREALSDEYEENSVLGNSRTHVSGCRIYNNALNVTVTRPLSGQGIVYVLVRLSDINIVKEI